MVEDTEWLFAVDREGDSGEGGEEAVGVGVLGDHHGWWRVAVFGSEVASRNELHPTMFTNNNAVKCAILYSAAIEDKLSL